MSINDDFAGEYDPGMPTTCRCGRTVDLNDMFDDPGGGDELVCWDCAQEARANS